MYAVKESFIKGVFNLLYNNEAIGVLYGSKELVNKIVRMLNTSPLND